MLGTTIEDSVESGAGSVAGLGVLEAVTVFHPEKVLGRPVGRWEGHDVNGYEIHHGVVSAADNFPGGTRSGTAFGTIWHGTLEGDGFRRAWLGEVAAASGSPWRPDLSAPAFADRREAMIDTLADACEEYLDLDRLLAMTEVAS